MPTAPYPIDDDTAEFIQRFVSINVASRNAENRPALARAAGCRVAEDKSRLTVYVARANNQTLLDNLRSNRCVAVVFSRPSSHRTIQFKGIDASIRDVTAEDQDVIRAYLESFRLELSDVGFPPAFCQAILPPAESAYLGISFTADRAYSQTPGPDAGKKLSP
jgi:hypothetical protein